jgi:predicted Rossmann-fold nucleotide-binding protein
VTIDTLPKAKFDIDSISDLERWLEKPVPAVFQGQDLRSYSQMISTMPLHGCVFLGCAMEFCLTDAAARANCFIIPRRDDLPFDPFTPGLYSAEELFDSVWQGGSYSQSLDRIVYESFMNPTTKMEHHVDVDVLLLRRIHDASITEALDDVLEDHRRHKTVAIMGGHDIGRDQDQYKTIAKLAFELTEAGYFIASGGGPGLMEAANMGAYCAGFDNPLVAIANCLDIMKSAPSYKDPNWVSTAFQARSELGLPSQPEKCRNLGIPTWFYGHEPPNLFATDIAKYFENSVREEGLLAIALGGIIFAPGNAGTVQEIFQDACQNYYRTYKRLKSPMILFGSDYWDPQSNLRFIASDRRKPVYRLLEKLAIEKGFHDYLCITDDPQEVLRFLKDHPPAS